MTAPSSGSAVTTQAALETLAGVTAADVRTAFARLNIRDLKTGLPNLAALTAALLDRYGKASATLAVQQYAAQRRDAGVAGAFTARVAQSDGLITQASNVVSWATQPLWSQTPQVDAAERNLVAGVEKLVLDRSRDTIISNAARDPKARGWARVTEANPCYFCALLATRGAVYKRDTAGFKSHDHCRCHAEPSFGPWEPSAQVREWQQLYRDSTSKGSPAKVRREWRHAFNDAYQK